MRNGQAVLAVILTISIVMTIGLAVVSRSVVGVKISTVAEEAARALDAAESGVNKSIYNPTANISGYIGSSTDPTSPTYNVPVANPINNGPNYVIPFEMAAGESATVMINGLSPASVNAIKLCWGSSTDPVATALEATIYYLSSGELRVKRKAFDVDNSRGNNFETTNVINDCWVTSGDPNDSTYSGSLSGLLVLADTPQFLRIKVLYNTVPVKVGIRATTALPAQGYLHYATGNAGIATAKIEASSTNWDLPPFFDDALFSGTNISRM